MLGRMREAVVIYGVMLSLFLAMIVWAVYWDTLQPNPALTAHAALCDEQGRPYEIEVEEGAVSAGMPSTSPRWLNSRSINRWATWRARNCASALRRGLPSRP